MGCAFSVEVEPVKISAASTRSKSVASKDDSTSSRPVASSKGKGVSKSVGAASTIEDEDEGSEPGGDGEPRPLRKFRFKELQGACSNFSAKCRVLGEGAFGKVYLGRIEVEGQLVEVAVKRLSEESLQGVDEWLSEVLILDKLRHSSLVRLVGYCKEKGECLLVYHYYPNDSVEAALFDRKKSSADPFTWVRRVQIAWQAAEALTFLHASNIIHRDFKPSNILLDKDWHGHLSDFGMSKEQEEGQSHVSTRVMGTMGYLDPSYMETGMLRQSSDVYAFGVFLLELITGKRAVGDNGQPLTNWVFPLLDQKKPEIDVLIDSSLDEEYDRDSALKIAIMAKFCIGEEDIRPEMGAIAERLKKVAQSVGVNVD